MSYILDALRRAEADRERERAQVPGLHAQPPAGGSAGGRVAQGPRRMGPVALGGAVVLLLLAGVGAGSWWASGGGGNPADRPLMPSAPTPQVSPPMAVPAPQPERRVEVPPQLPAPAPMQPAPALPAMAGAAAVPAPSPAPALSPAVVAQPHAPLAAPSPLAAQQAAAPATAPIPRLAELPESLRRELPKLTISGSVYSEDPASRFVIANGEVLREGATLGPEHVLEQIGPRELVLRFKGQRYRQAL